MISDGISGGLRLGGGHWPRLPLLRFCRSRLRHRPDDRRRWWPGARTRAHLTHAHTVGRPLRAYHIPPPRCCLSRPSSRASGSRSKVLAPDLRRYVLASSVGMPPSTSLSRLCSPHLHTETRSASSQDRARTFILAKCTIHLPHCVLWIASRGAPGVYYCNSRILCISTTPILIQNT